jgi:flagellar hook-associated protein 1 FlgK
VSGSFGGILSIARSAIRTYQVAVEVTSQNIANAQTEGYTRVRPTVGPLPPRYTPQGVLGTGVTVRDVARVRDVLLDATFRRESARAAGAEAREGILARLEDLFAEPSENGLAATLDRFYDAWSDLANSPTSSTAKSVVQQRGRQLALWFNGADTRLSQVRDETRTRLNEQVTRVNRIAEGIARLNAQIVSEEAGGVSATQTRDERDRLVDELAALAGAETIEDQRGAVAVIVAGQTLVDKGEFKALNPPDFDSITGTVRLSIGASEEPIQRVDGSVGALLRVINDDITALRTRLDTLATAVVHGTNRWHRMGWSAAGDAAGLAGENYDPATPAALRGSRVDFFASPAGTAPGTAPTVTARNIRLSALVDGDPAFVAAGIAGGTGATAVPAPGDNRIALGIAGMREATGAPDDTSAVTTDPAPLAAWPGIGTTSPGAYWRETVGTLGLDIAAARGDREVGEVLRTQADTRRQSVAGVSIDEELIALQRYQQSFAAASRIITVVNEMTQDLLNMVR